MKYLLVSCLFIVGCSYKNHEKEKANIIKKANAYCECHGGISYLRYTQYSNIPDSGHVTCKDAIFFLNVDELEYACGKKIE